MAHYFGTSHHFSIRGLFGTVCCTLVVACGGGESTGSETDVDTSTTTGTETTQTTDTTGDPPTTSMTDPSGSESDTAGPTTDSDSETDSQTDTDSDSESDSDTDPTGGEDLCGNGELDPDEACDDGVNDGAYGGCEIDCSALAPYCGDGEVNGPETCDDGNDDDGDACTNSCALASCGDGVIQEGEACDDGNAENSDECLDTCVLASCGDGFVQEGVEECDDANELDTDACLQSCVAATCGDAFVYEGVEVCDDGVNDNSYDGCASDCLTLGPYCGDGEQNGEEQCDDANDDSADGCLASCVSPASCVELKAYDDGLESGVFTIDPDGPEGLDAYAVYCEMVIDGGGWQLISVRHTDADALFADNICTALDQNCSGTVYAEQLQQDLAPDILFATNSGDTWLRLTGFNPPGSNTFIDVITLDRLLTTSSTCGGSHYCGANLDTMLQVAGSSDDFMPRFDMLPSQFVRYGGVWFGNGGGSQQNHGVSMNYVSYCGADGGVDISDDSDQVLGNVVCGEAGGIYFKY